MKESILWNSNQMIKSDDPQECLKILTRQELEKARTFHASFPAYKETPLVSLNTLAQFLGVQKIYLKDESHRFGLKAFKALGGSYAMGRYLAEKLGCDISELDYKKITSEETRNKIGSVTFYSATDGNHGRGVAWTAKQLGQKAVIYMPKGSSLTRLEAIRNEGAEAEITNLNYDDAVRLAAKKAEETGGVVVQDTAWPGYEKIPTWIMQGYGAMALEAYEQMQKDGTSRPTHIFIQAGVGSLAGAIQGFFANVYPNECPITIVVEADTAACLYKSATINDGQPHAVGGDMPTIMAGLACGEANIIAFEILKNWSSHFVSCPNWVSANGMRILAAPLTGDTSVISGESGAVTTGLLASVCRFNDNEELKKSLKIDKNSRILLFSTEGDTDPAMYRRIVWDGAFPGDIDG